MLLCSVAEELVVLITSCPLFAFIPNRLQGVSKQSQTELKKNDPQKICHGSQKFYKFSVMK